MKPRNREINIFNISMLDVISGGMGAFLLVMFVLLPYYGKEYTREEMERLQGHVDAAQREATEAVRRAEVARARVEEITQHAAEAETEASEVRRRAAEAEAEASEARRRASAAQEEARRRAAEAEARAARAEADARVAKARLSKTFLVVSIRWTAENQDVDLHVVDPAGGEFYYKRKTVPGHPGELTEDDRYGPGTEVWEIQNAPAGTYRLYANLYRRQGNPENPRVRGRVSYRDGTAELPEVRLTVEDESGRMKTPMGTVTVQEDGDVEVR